MLAVNAQMTLARAWSDAAFGTMAAAWSAYADAVARAMEVFAAPSAGPEKRESQQRCGLAAPLTSRSSRASPAAQSWYRPPAPRPFSAPAFQQSFPPLMPDVWSLLPAMSALMPMPIWGIAIAALRVTELPAGPAGFHAWTAPDAWNAASRSSPAGSFSTYRSDGGHAVTQVTFPNDVVAAIAIPPTQMPFSLLELWRMPWTG
jgi:hypothetical protein